MRWIIVLLLLINGGYFAWQYYYIPGADSDIENELVDGHEYDTLVLLSDLSEERKELLGIVGGETEKNIPGSRKTDTTSEMPDKPLTDDKIQVEAKILEPRSIDNASIKKPAELQTSAKTNTESATKMDSKYCYVIGPIKKKAHIDRLSKHIRSMDLDIIKVRKTINKIPSHWIYLSGYKSEDEAKKAISRLVSKGVKDTQLIKRSATNIVISVGLFSTKPGADKRLKKLEDSGFTPQTSMVTANKSLYWIDLKYKDGQKVDESLLMSLSKGMTDTKVEQGNCQ
ncbi:MAG: SPOR domain-containing protein [Gammaproteobacteria bacterium]|nr:SPOR domain-containing protein [Gammaproteobacteria bacterium]